MIALLAYNTDLANRYIHYKFVFTDTIYQFLLNKIQKIEKFCSYIRTIDEIQDLIPIHNSLTQIFRLQPGFDSIYHSITNANQDFISSAKEENIKASEERMKIIIDDISAERASVEQPFEIMGIPAVAYPLITTRVFMFYCSRALAPNRLQQHVLIRTSRQHIFYYI